MAEFQADQQWADHAQANSLGKLTYAIGSLVSIGLVVGMGVWGYKLLVRDVSGVPVIRAAEGPIRIQPEDPGGRQALHQGLSVNDVAAAGSAAEAADRLILAPAPLDLSFEDTPSTGNTGLTSASLNNGASASVDDTASSEPQSDVEAALALADSIAQGVEPLEDLQPIVASSPKIKGGLGRSLRPRLRPETLSRIQTVSAPTSVVPKEIDAASVPTGTRLAQLGAFKSEEIAREEWIRLSGKFEEYLAGKGRVIQKAESGGRTFYRLRAMGFDDLADARRFCSALVAEKAECIPVVTR